MLIARYYKSGGKFSQGGLSHELECDQVGGDLPTLKARKDLTDEFKEKMLRDNPVRFYRLGEGDIAAARKAKGN